MTFSVGTNTRLWKVWKKNRGKKNSNSKKTNSPLGRSGVLAYTRLSLSVC